MECRKAEEMVSKYIDRTMNVKEMEAFLEHVEKCNSCYDELETYYIVNEAMAQLDNDDRDTVLDMKNMLRQDIWNSRLYIQRIKAVKLLLVCGAVVICGIAAGMLVYSLLDIFKII